MVGLQQVIGVITRVIVVEKLSQSKSVFLVEHVCLLNSYFEEFYIFNYILNACYLTSST